VASDTPAANCSSPATAVGVSMSARGQATTAAPAVTASGSSSVTTLPGDVAAKSSVRRSLARVTRPPNPYLVEPPPTSGQRPSDKKAQAFSSAQNVGCRGRVEGPSETKATFCTSRQEARRTARRLQTSISPRASWPACSWRRKALTISSVSSSTEVSATRASTVILPCWSTLSRSQRANRWA